MKEGDIIFHEDLNNLILCRDKYWNLVYNDEDLAKFNDSEVKRFTVDNGGEFHTSRYEEGNTFNQFKVLSIDLGKDGYGHGYNDVYPAATNVVVCPVEDENYLIHFYTNTNCYAHRIDMDKIEII